MHKGCYNCEHWAVKFWFSIVFVSGRSQGVYAEPQRAKGDAAARTAVVRLRLVSVGIRLVTVDRVCTIRYVMFSKREVNKDTWRALTSAKAKLVRIHSPYPKFGYWSRLWIRTSETGDFQNLTGISLFKVTRSSDQFVQRYGPNCGKMLEMLKNLSKNPGSGSGSGWLPNCDRIFFVYRYICGKVYRKIHSVVLCKVANRQTDGQTDRQTDKQTNAGHYIASLAEVTKTKWTPTIISSRN